MLKGLGALIKEFWPPFSSGNKASATHLLTRAWDF